MKRSALALLCLLTMAVPLSAQQNAPTLTAARVTVGTMRAVTNSALFIAAAKGYFKNEGLDIDMTAYTSDKDVADGVASGATDFGLGLFTPSAFNYAGNGLIRIVAAQVREKSDTEGDQILASNRAYARGVRKLGDIANTAAAITEIGSIYHYQLAQIARTKKFDFGSITLKTFRTQDDMAKAVGTAQADIAILSAHYAREMLLSGQAKLVGWYSEVDEQQLGALFVNTKMLNEKKPLAEKFVRAYLRGVADYAATMAKRDRTGKRQSSPESRETATIIARYVFPGQPAGPAAMTVEGSAYYMDPQGRIDMADLARQVEWFKAQGLIDRKADARAMVDQSFVK